MDSRIRLRVPFPETVSPCLPLWPVFLPFAGCPGRCLYCDQDVQTGRSRQDPDVILDGLAARLEQTSGPFAMGFFGGTFTGLSPDWQARFLALAAAFRGADRLQHVRISTRPDCLDLATARRLREQGVDMIELGVQTFDSEVLSQSRRGYIGETARHACALVRQAGLELGVQLLPGLPGHDAQVWREDVRQTLATQPDVVRIYPCVVMAKTGLAALYAHGHYSPWSLDLTVAEVAWALPQFWAAGVRVIRLGLAAEPDMVANLLAGPWHPAFGNMVRSEVLRHFLERKIMEHGQRLRTLFLPRRLSGDLWGHKRAQAASLARLGIVPERVRFWDQRDIVLEMESL